MTSTPAISVVIPHYNAAESLEQTLDSVLAQSQPAQEVIVVDDASPDLSQREAARKLCGSKGVTFLGQEVNSGPGVARNVGWDHAVANGARWIAFCDSDDTWHPSKLERQSELLEPGVSIVGCDMVTLNRREPFPVVDGSIRPVSITIDRLVRGNPFSTSSVILDASLPIRFTPGRNYCEDYEVWGRAVAAGKAAYLPEGLCARHKAAFGASGLSAQLKKMARGEYDTFRRFRRDRIFSPVQYAKATALIPVKLARRVVLSRLGQHRSESR